MIESHLHSKKKAIVLLSGGLDSATCLAHATHNEGFECYALSFDYGQKQIAELHAASRIAKQFGARHLITTLPIAQFGQSALTDNHIAIPEHQDSTDIPVTYVPARNTIFLAFALGWAESLGARDIFIGVSAIDYSNYADCRPEYIEAFQRVATLGTKIGVEEGPIQIHTPLIHLSKAETIQLGHQLGVDYSLTVTCYAADKNGAACGKCSSCVLRKRGFEAAQLPDPTCYA
jgi:7-cyano-7-deazaguanine synthase